MLNAYQDGAAHAHEIVTEGYDAARLLLNATNSGDDWDRGYVETLKKLAK